MTIDEASYLDWVYAKRKQKDPNLSFESFDDVLKESIDKLKDKDEVVKNKRGNK
jgi:CRISPR/Cas system CSM-associated protein Csm2 small subunit